MLFDYRFLCVVSRGLGLILGLSLMNTGRAPAQTSAPDTQCLMLPLEPALRARQSTLIVEAQVLNAQSFWDAAHGHLFTRHRLRVFSLLKGALTDTTSLVLLTEGGQLGLDQQILTNTLRLTPGQQGVFFLTSAPWSGLPDRSWTTYGSAQGFIEYNPGAQTAAEPFRTYGSIDLAFYREITRFTGQIRQVLRVNPALQVGRVRGQRSALAPIIGGFSPARLPAGAGAILTIDGTGFGPSRGSGLVEFRNADDGGTTRVQARSGDYLSWTDTRIQVRVPSSASGGQPVGTGHPAGSGPVRVTTADQQMVESADAVTIVYALTNVESTDVTLLQRPNHITQNAHGGVSFHFSPNFTTNPAASVAWQRALTTWRCQTGMNWEISSPSPTNAIADDGQNVIAFAAAGELPARVLGRTTSYYRGCYAPTGEVVFWVNEIDMQFDSGATFQFGPAPAVSALNQVDFESVAVHELGHAQQLSHLNLPGAVMHYAIRRGQNTRALDLPSDVAGGRQVLRGRSFRNLGCGGPALVPAPLTGFSAQYAGAGATLTWTTADECFLSRFQIERSLGADTLAWEVVGMVAARPPAGQYQFTDAQPLVGLHYYRLRLVRPDGSLDNVAPTALSSEGNTTSIFPNPVTGDQLRLQYPAAMAGAVIFRFYDTLGRQLRASQLTVPGGLNILTLEVADFRPGLYVLHWQDEQGHTGSRKFVRR